MKLRHKIQLCVVGAVVALGALTLGLFSFLERHIINENISQDVLKARPVVTRYMGRWATDLTNRAELIADLPTVRSAILGSNLDPATVHQRFQEYESRLGADSYFITDDRGKVVTSQGGNWTRVTDASLMAGVRSAMEGRTWTGTVSSTSGLLLGISIPVKVGGYVKGTINDFEVLGARAAGELAEDLSAPVAILHNGQIVASSLPNLSIESSGTLLKATSGGSEFVGSGVSLDDRPTREKASLVTFRDVESLARPFKESELALLAVFAVICLLVAFGSKSFSERVLAHVTNLLHAAEILKAGEWPDPITVSRRDEIGVLESAFNEMAASLKTNQETILSRSEALKDALSQAESATIARTQFLATVSHELRTPLNGSIGMIGELRESELSSGQRQWLDAVGTCNEHLLTLVDDILSYVALESGKAHLEASTFDLDTLISDVVKRHAKAANAKCLVLKTELAPSTAIRFRSDRRRLEELLGHLLSNAIKFTAAGSVTVSAKVAGDRVKISVHDTGCGIDASRQQRIFDPFVQADGSSTRSFEGTGLGLAICQQVALMLNATLAVESEKGVGSTFTLSVASSAQEETHPPKQERAQQSGALRVLIVDDNELNLKVAARVCQKAGLEVSCVTGGGDAIVEAQMGFDLILMDCHMPGIDGFAATKAIRAAEGNHRTPIHALTASDMEDDRRAAEESGMDGYIVKPLRDDKLAHLLGREPQLKAA